MGAPVFARRARVPGSKETGEAHPSSCLGRNRVLTRTLQHLHKAGATKQPRFSAASQVKTKWIFLSSRTVDPAQKTSQVSGRHHHNQCDRFDQKTVGRRLVHSFPCPEVQQPHQTDQNARQNAQEKMLSKMPLSLWPPSCSCQAMIPMTTVGMVASAAASKL
jgi:hypothetical protein